MFGVNMEKNASLLVSIFVSLFGGVLFETGKYGMKKSIMFWDMAKIVETKLHDAKSTDELNGLINEHFVKGGELRKLSMGGPHITEMNRLYTIYQVYYKVQNKK
jgi:hypothetical protein